jgi:hypothetical protein
MRRKGQKKKKKKEKRKKKTLVWAAHRKRVGSIGGLKRGTVRTDSADELKRETVASDGRIDRRTDYVN